MTRYILTAALVLTASLGPRAAVAEETLESVEAKLLELWAELDSYAAKLDITMTMEQGTMTMKGTGAGIIEVLVKGDNTLYRSEVTMTMAMGGQTMEVETLTVYDGEFVFTESEMFGQKMVMKASQSQQPGPALAIGKKALEEMHKFEVALKPEERIGETPTYVIEMTPKADSFDPARAKLGKIRSYIDKETGVQIRTTVFDKAGKEMINETLSEVKINPELDEGRFAYEPPEGAQVRDMTQDGFPGMGTSR
ncbi:MAG TPA: outer membrane lipoprotein carrier protein LolA [Candidatus Hydrogenedentes bacterium]|nr:outer membrane lipoprotein carrier protein LolA [Candidatus Hydrogenedentota bacterium]